MKRVIDNIGFILIVVIIGLTFIFLILPIIISVLMSFDSRDYLGPFPPTGFSLNWYKQFFSDTYYLNGLKLSLILALSSTLISTGIGVTAAIVLERYNFPGKGALSAFFLSPLVVPAVVLGFSLLLFFAMIGIFSGFPRLLGAHIIITTPYTIRTTLAGLVGIRKSMTEAALSLGANEMQAFWVVTFPLARTGIMAGAIFAFAFSMDEVAASLFLSDPRTYTLPIAMVSMMRSNFDLTIAAVAVILMAFTLVIVLLLDRLLGLDKIIGQGVYK